MKKLIWSKILSTVLTLSMLLAMLPVTSFSTAAETIGQAGSFSAIPELDSVIEENAPDMAEVVAFAEGLTTGYGPNGKFLVQIGDPEPGSIPISTRTELEAIGNNAVSLSGKYHLVNDIDLGGAEWVPIGDNSTTSNKFTGTFDGQGHVIKNLTVTGSTYQYAGLFGYASGATIKNVGLEDMEINVFPSSTSYAGGICGSSSSSITNCYNTGDITSSSSSSSYAGGICGYSYSSITNCYNTGDITSSSSFSSSYAGGICGNSYNSSSLTNCYNTGDISSSSSSSYAYAGGICGNSYNSSSLTNCYNTGDISSSSSSYDASYAGGICGYSSSSSSITNCYNTGDITSSSSSSSSSSCAGGICGYSSSSITNCYNTGDISSSSSSYAYAGGICGYSSSSSITNCYNTGDISSSSSSSFSSSSYAGGICGYSYSTVNINNCVTLAKRIYAENTVNPVNARSYLIGYGGTNTNNLAIDTIQGNISVVDDTYNDRISLAEAKSQATYEGLGWDFGSVWIMDPDYDYPQLRGLPYHQPKTDPTYRVTFNAGAHGKMIPSPAFEDVGYQRTVTGVPSITPDEGYEFIGWSSNIGSIDGKTPIFSEVAIKLYPVNGTVTFTAQYKLIDVTLMIEGKHNDTVLYSYSKSVQFSKTPIILTAPADVFEVPGFVRENGQSYSVIPDKNKTVSFKYATLATTVKVRMVNESLVDIASSFEVAATSGGSFSYYAPNVPGYRLTSDSLVTINPVLPGGVSEISFKYAKINSKIAVEYREETPTGSLIRTDEITDDTVGTGLYFDPPPTLSGYYSLISPTYGRIYYDFNGSDAVTIIACYTKNLVNITINKINYGDSTVIEAADTVNNQRQGEAVTITAPTITGWVPVGPASQTVIADSGASLSFSYRTLANDEVQVKAIDKESGNVLQSYVMAGTVGESITIKAPDILGWALASASSQDALIGADQEVVFEYVKNVVEVTVNFVRESGGDSIMPATVAEVPRGGNYTVYAPHIAGYVIDGVSIKTLTNVVADNDLYFYYKTLSEEDEENYVTITVRGVNSEDGQLYSYLKRIAKADLPYTLINGTDIFAVPGYSLDSGQDPLVTGEGSYTFNYTTTAGTVKISLKEQGTGVPVGAGSFNVPATIGAAFSYHAPDVSGYRLVSPSNIGTVNLVAADGSSEIVFEYARLIINVTYAAGDNGEMDPDPASEEVIYGGAVANVPGIDSDPGYIFAGWESSLGGIYNSIAIRDYRLYNDVTFIAQYADADKATVVFNYNGGNDDEGKSYSISSGKSGDLCAVPQPAKEGFDFAGWLPDATDLRYGEEGSIDEYTAQWQANTYTVSFRAGLNGGIDPPDYSEKVKHGEKVVTIPSGEGEAGYVFVGWECKENNYFYSNGRLKNYPITSDMTFTALYADDNEVIVVFDYNGGKDEEGKHFRIISVKPSIPYAVPLPGLAGHTFNSWVPYLPEDTFGEESDTTYYYAQWTANTYTVTFQAGTNGKMTPENPENTGIYREFVSHGESVKNVPVITANAGYTTQNLWVIKDGDGSIYSRESIFGMPITGDIFFIAQYGNVTSPSGGGGGGETAILTVKAIDKATNLPFSIQETPILVGKTEKISAQQFPDYVLAEDCEPTKSITIKAGNNTVEFFYNKKDEPSGGGGRFFVSEKIKEVLETEEHIQYINGYPDGTVRPNSNISRAEVAIIFWRLLKAPEKNDVVANTFSDLKGDESYAQAVKYLAKIGILQGYEDGSFRPSRGITRAEFVAIACRFDDLGNSNSNPFTDLSGSHWAYAYIISAYLKEWISGYPDGEFKPQNGISRAEVVKIVNCMLGRGIKLIDLPEDLPSYADLNQTHWAYCEIMEATVSHEFERQEDGWEVWK